MIAILWHLHQPEYRDPFTGVPVMPWTRLHGLRGYRDMFVEALEHGPAWTLNVVPTLLDQLDRYAAGGSDPHLDLTARPADALDAADRDAIRATFVGGHPRMRAAFPAWDELSRRLTAGERLTTNEWRDVQVWSTLAWFGATAVRDHPALRSLRHKARRFTEDDKATVLGAQRAILAELPGLFSRLAQSHDGAAVSVTPYHHPILPLVVDVQHARRCGQHPPRDLHFRHPEHALEELISARDAMRRRLGREVTGLWPSEGAVSPEVVHLAARAGFRWLATDEGILARSDRSEASGVGSWDLGHGVRGFFRDHDLSDRIGFRYQDARPEDAAAELVGTALRRAAGGVITLALDGENPWEAYPEAGGPFRRALIAALAGRAITFDQACQRRPVGHVRRLHTGSWIGADLRIWCGDAADHAAWRLLADVRAATDRAGPAAHAAARPHLAAAAGSDWFWWFGPEFSTPFAASFDLLFRRHLTRACEAAGVPPVPGLDAPVTAAPTSPLDPPHGLVHPSDGPPTWEGWRGAGTIRWPLGGSMAVTPPVDDARYGWDDTGALWVWIRWRERPIGRAVVLDGVRHVVGTAPAGPVRHDADDGLILALPGRREVDLWLDVDGVRIPPEGALRLALDAPPTAVWWST